jgi:hypothetical protein
MIIWAYCLVSISLFKIILDIANPDLFSSLSLVLDNVIYAIILTLIIRITYMQKQGKREKLKEKLSELEKSIAETHED